MKLNLRYSSPLLNKTANNVLVDVPKPIRSKLWFSYFVEGGGVSNRLLAPTP